MNSAAPCLVWLPVDHRLLGKDGHQTPFVVLDDKYARDIKLGADVQPVLFPLAEPQQMAELLAVVDGGASAFAYAVQWHPEWGCANGGLDAAIFKAFGESCRVRRQNRLDPAGVSSGIDPWRT